MLTETERNEIDAKLESSETRKQAAVEVLAIVQRHRGWISDETLEDVARYLGLHPAEVDSVASFYNLIFREPVGRHVIYLCDSISCHVMGCDAIRQRIEQTLDIRPGETTSDGEFTLLPAECLGACDRAPAMIVDETLYGPLTPDGVGDILERVKNGAAESDGEPADE